MVVSIGENDGFSIGLVYTTINLAMSGREGMPKIQQYTSDLGIIIHTATIHTEETGETIFCLYIQHMYICIFIVHMWYICCKKLYCSSLLVG